MTTKIINLYSGDTFTDRITETFHLIADEQSKGNLVAFVDIEGCFDPVRARKAGVNLDDILVSKPDTEIQGREIVTLLSRSHSVDLIIIASRVIGL